MDLTKKEGKLEQGMCICGGGKNRQQRKVGHKEEGPSSILSFLSFFFLLLWSVLAEFLPGSHLRFGWVTSLFSVTKNVTRYICHISGKNVTLSHMKIFFWLVMFFVTSFPKNVTFWPRRYKTFLNGKKCDDSARTETCFSLPVSDLSLISEVWSGKAIWAKTDPYAASLWQTPCFICAKTKRCWKL